MTLILGIFFLEDPVARISTLFYLSRFAFIFVYLTYGIKEIRAVPIGFASVFVYFIDGI